MKFAVIGSTFGRTIVTANDDGTVGLNAKYGTAVEDACIEQANLAHELLEALKLAASIIGHPDDEASKQIAAVIAKATAAAGSGL